MSRPRTRPTREQTREQLVRAAAQVFARQGIGDSSIEDICDEAGYSRGAFYSSFGTKDDLVLALLDLNTASSATATEKMLAESSDPTDFIDNMESDRRERNGPLDFEDGSKLYIELILHALRNPESRPLLVEHHRRQRDSNKRFVEQITSALGRDYPVATDDVVSIIMALDFGLLLSQLIDPESYRPTQFSETMGILHRLWLAAPEDALDDLPPLD